MSWKVAVITWLRQVECEEEACVERIAALLWSTRVYEPLTRIGQ